jgi:hypothetical protein
MSEKVMKISLLLILLVLLPASAQVTSAQATSAQVTSAQITLPGTQWSQAAVVNVHFVRDVFTAAERQTLQEAMESWARTTKTGGEIRFVFAEETGGLIDCVRCLTIARQVVSRDRQRKSVSFNVLRQDAAGRLLSAWIAFESSTSQSSLSTLMVRALQEGFGAADSQTARNRRR